MTAKDILKDLEDDIAECFSCDYTGLDYEPTKLQSHLLKAMKSAVKACRVEKQEWTRDYMSTHRGVPDFNAAVAEQDKKIEKFFN